MPKLSEKGLYPALEEYLRAQQDCAHIRIDFQLQIESSPRNRPDLGGRTREGILHLVEAKLGTQRTDVFHQMSQLESVRGYADHLWAALSSTAWDRYETDVRDGHRSRLRQAQLGLLIVDAQTGSVKVELDAPRNTAVKPVLRARLAEALRPAFAVGGPASSLLALPRSLSREDARIASDVLLGVQEYMRHAKAILQGLQTGKRGKVGCDRAEIDQGTADALLLQMDGVAIRRQGSEPDELSCVEIEGDPFGVVYARDGLPRLWVWTAWHERLGVSEELIEAAPDWYVYGDTEDESWCDALLEIDPAHYPWEERRNYCLGRPIALLARTRPDGGDVSLEGFQRELERVLRRARSEEFQAVIRRALRPAGASIGEVYRRIELEFLETLKDELLKHPSGDGWRIFVREDHADLLAFPDGEIDPAGEVSFVALSAQIDQPDGPLGRGVLIYGLAWSSDKLVKQSPAREAVAALAQSAREDLERSDDPWWVAWHEHSAAFPYEEATDGRLLTELVQRLTAMMEKFRQELSLANQRLAGQRV